MKLTCLLLLILAGCGGSTNSDVPGQITSKGHFFGQWTSNNGSGKAEIIIPECTATSPCQTVGNFSDKIFVLGRDGYVVSSEVPNCPVGAHGTYTDNPTNLILTMNCGVQATFVKP